MSLETSHTANTSSSEPFTYRQLSTAAVVSLGLGLFSVSAVPAGASSWGAYTLILPFPIAGIVLGWLALGHVRESGDALTGKRFAISGVVLSALFLFTGAAVASWIYMHEVPEGAHRIHFSWLEPDSFELADGMTIPPDVAALAGRRIFIKGYMRPGPFQNYIKDFLLVKDNSQCCFGPLEEVQFFDQIRVLMKPPMTVDYDTRLFKVAGTLAVDPRGLRHSEIPVYSLLVDYVR